MFNNAYQNLELKIDLLSGGTIAGLREKIKSVLGNKILILCGLLLSGAPKLPVVCEPNIYVTQTEEPDDWDEEEDGEFVPEDVYHLEASNIYGYDIAIEDNVVTCSEMSLKVDTLTVNELTSEEDEISAQKPIVEVMDAYSYEAPTNEKCTQEIIYAGIVKNGNKLTAVVYEKVNIDADNTNDFFQLGNFVIPSTIAAKLYPTEISGASFLDNRKISFVNALSSMVDLYAYTQKGDSRISLACYGIQSLTKAQDYYVRYEVTFLLSDNLAE